MIDVKNLKKSFHGHCVLQGIDEKIEKLAQLIDVTFFIHNVDAIEPDLPAGRFLEPVQALFFRRRSKTFCLPSSTSSLLC